MKNPLDSAPHELATLWSQWQPKARASQVGGKTWSLADYDPAAKPFARGDKSAEKAALKDLAEGLDALQQVFYADKRFKLLVVLQGMDASGKDGTIRGVFGGLNPLGVRAVSWKAPTETELQHDYLWRIHQQVPAAGEITVFNRSHYEDVLVPVVAGSIDAACQQQRLAQINDFERMLSENGCVILKFFLHISREEQRERLQQRLDDPNKRWKFSASDVQARAHWDDYQRAYEALLQTTSTAWAPWTIVPANSKTHRNLMIATLLHAVMNGLGLRYPPADPGLATLRIS